MKYVLVSGGVISGIGKGVLASSTGLLLKTIGLKISPYVSSIKIDPYLNIDAGTMNPIEHGEVFVLDDGGEVDLDLGNYERYLNITLTRENNITTGKIYQHVIEKERKGRYLGKTVQVVPHITDAIQDWIQRVAAIPVDDSNETPDVCIVELGGTVGDIENAPFIEAMRSLRRRAGKNNFLQIHVSLVPIINGEQKSKPTQEAIRQVRSGGLSPDLIACRCEETLEEATIGKVANFCMVELDQVVAVKNTSTYRVPNLLAQQGLIKSLRDILHLDEIPKPSKMLERGQGVWHEWETLTSEREPISDEVKIALVGKYTKLHDAYLSIKKSLEHATMHCKRKLDVMWVEASNLQPETEMDDPKLHQQSWRKIYESDGMLVPGGFGDRGIEGMILAIKYARENDKPFLGVCLGMQVAVIEFARNVCGIPDADSQEFRPTGSTHVIVDMAEIDQEQMGGTMRLGLHTTAFQPGSEWSKIRALYGVDNKQKDAPTKKIKERHRHRKEVNPKFVNLLESHGLSFVGKDDVPSSQQSQRMEILEMRTHKYFVGVQFHPEYLSRVIAPSKPFLGLVAACAGMLDEVTEDLRVQCKSPDRARRGTEGGLGSLSTLSLNEQVDGPVVNGVDGH
ncbi:MAG: CTP synthase ura7 [Alyxoria varia]|nr:MAG: CTP synthase ura7 [Alyxoria varia]